MDYAGEDNLDMVKLAENYNDFLAREVAAVIKPSDEVIVDFGSGEAYMTQKIEDICAKKIICIEPAVNLHKYYQNRTRLDSLDELNDNSADVIYSLNVLEHIEDDQAVIEKFYNKLKTGGRLLLYVPACQILYSSMDKKVGHYRRYSKTDLQRLLLSEKWKLKKLSYADFIGFFATLAYLLFGAKDGSINPAAIKFYDKFLTRLSFFIDKITFGKLPGKNILLIAEKKVHYGQEIF